MKLRHTLPMPKKVVSRLKQEPRPFFFRAWRKYRGLTQDALAGRVGLATSSISQIETGQQGFTDSTLLAFADALQCEPGDLLSRDPNVDDAISELVRMLRKATAADQQRALHSVRGILSVQSAPFEILPQEEDEFSRKINVTVPSKSARLGGVNKRK